MPFDSSALLAPSAGTLPLLFEVARLLGRHPDLGEALAPLLKAVEAGSPLKEGCAALAGASEGVPLRIVVSSPLAKAAPGSRVVMSEGPLGKVVEEGRSVEGEDGGGPWVAAPSLIHGSVAAILAFRRPSDFDAAEARSLVDALAVLIGEAILLRRLLASEGGGEDPRSGHWGQTRTADLPLGDSAEEHRGLLGRSAAMAELRSLVEKVGPTDSTVLVTGESGTGKELAARALHEASARASGPFVAVNCAALPESLIESELFGHERGSFTGAEARRRGRFELAAGGSLFFDEVGELGPAVQAKLLRVIQERSFERVGGSESIKADVRLIAATNRELEAEVAAGRFRQDLYWRLNVFSIRMPPLRERGGDVILLADHFAETLGTRLGKPVLRISTPAIDLLVSYHWPGNVRELENAIERAVVLSTDGVIHAWHLPPSLQSAASTGTGPNSTLDSSLSRIERELIVEALKMNSGRAVAAARALGITERRMGLAMRKYGIDWRRFRTKM
jgi:Nif-specific regulatory protein